MGKGDMSLSLCKGDMIWCLENSSDSMNILLQLVNYNITKLALKHCEPCYTSIEKDLERK